MTVKTWALSIRLACTSLTLAGCARLAEPLAPAPLAPGDPSTLRPSVTPPTEPLDVVLAWIECDDECDRARQAVVELGPAVTPLLVQLLSDGPPPAQLEAMQAHLEQAFGELAAYGRSHPEAALSMELDEYLGVYLENYQALYRVRSAQALVSIGDPESIPALQRALRSAERTDVRQALQQALQQFTQLQ